MTSGEEEGGRPRVLTAPVPPPREVNGAERGGGGRVRRCPLQGGEVARYLSRFRLTAGEVRKVV